MQPRRSCDLHAGLLPGFRATQQREERRPQRERQHEEHHAAIVMQPSFEEGGVHVDLPQREGHDPNPVLQNRQGEDGERHSWQLVFAEFADFDDGMVSLASPLGRAVLGARPGDRVQLQAPGGARGFLVVEIVTVHGETLSDEGGVDTPPDQEEDDG